MARLRALAFQSVLTRSTRASLVRSIGPFSLGEPSAANAATTAGSMRVGSVCLVDDASWKSNAVK